MAAATTTSTSSTTKGPTYNLVATCSNVIKTWELDEVEAQLHHRQDVSVSSSKGSLQGPWNCVRFNHNFQVLACGNEAGKIALLLENGKILEVLDEHAQQQQQQGAAAAAAAGGEGGGQQQRRLSGAGAPEAVTSLAWGGRSRYLVTTGVNNCPSLWDLKRKEKVRAFQGHQSTVMSVAFSADDSHVASGNKHGDILLHHLKQEEATMVLPLNLPNSTNTTTLTPSSTIAAGVRSLNYWAMRQPLLLSGYRNGDARVWDTATGQCLNSFKGQHQAPISALCGSTVNNKLMATAGLDRRLMLFDVNQRKLLREIKAVAPINDMSFSGDGKMIVVGCSNGDVSVYDLRKPTVPCQTVRAYQEVGVKSLSIQNKPNAGSGSGNGNGGTNKAPSSTTTAATSKSTTTAATTTTPMSPAKTVATTSTAALPTTNSSSNTHLTPKKDRVTGAPPPPPASSSSRTHTHTVAMYDDAAAAGPSFPSGGVVGSDPPPPSTSTSAAPAAPPTPTTIINSKPSRTSTSAPIAMSTDTDKDTHTHMAPPPPKSASSSLPSASNNTPTNTHTQTAAQAPPPPSQLPKQEDNTHTHTHQQQQQPRLHHKPQQQQPAPEKAKENEKPLPTSVPIPSSSTTTHKTNTHTHTHPSSSSFHWHNNQSKQQQEIEKEHKKKEQDEKHKHQQALKSAAEAAAAAAALGGKEMAKVVEMKVRDMVDELREELARDMRDLHLELMRTSESTQVAMQGLARTFSMLVEENKGLRKEVEDLQSQMEMPF